MDSSFKMPTGCTRVERDWYRPPVYGQLLICLYCPETHGQTLWS